MTLTPEFLPVGSIVYYNIESIEHPEWTPTKLDAVDLQWLDGDPEAFNIAHKPIPLTPEILVEWCGFERFEHTYHLNGFNIDLEFIYCIVDANGFSVYEYPNDGYRSPIQYLHQLQLLYSALTQTHLPIKIK